VTSNIRQALGGGGGRFTDTARSMDSFKNSSDDEVRDSPVHTLAPRFATDLDDERDFVPALPELSVQKKAVFEDFEEDLMDSILEGSAM
jgi:hypothetical protein